METNDLDYFKQKLYEISRVPKFSLEKIEENRIVHNEVLLERRFYLLERRFWKFVEYLIKPKSNKNI